MSGKDVMGITQTGTGKTLAYLLPVLKTWKYNKTEVNCTYSCSYVNWWCKLPEVVEKLTEDMSTRVLGVYGGVNINTQKNLLVLRRCRYFGGNFRKRWIYEKMQFELERREKKIDYR